MKSSKWFHQMIGCVLVLLVVVACAAQPAALPTATPMAPTATSVPPTALPSATSVPPTETPAPPTRTAAPAATPGSSTVTDIDGNVYRTAKIGSQWWMAENLRVTHYRSGAPIPNVTDDQEWSSLDGGAYSYYEHEPGNIALYGLLYNWFAVDDTQGICPAGWHVPGDEEWKELELYLGMTQDEAGRASTTDWRGTDEGGKLKATGTSHWQSPNTGATNASDFSALPGGGRPGYGIWGGGFYYKGQKASFWTSSEHDATEAWMRNLDYDSSGVRRRTIAKRYGFSVRCAHD